jgi:hypothetical protein
LAAAHDTCSAAARGTDHGPAQRGVFSSARAERI